MNNPIPRIVIEPKSIEYNENTFADTENFYREELEVEELVLGEV